MVIEPTCGVGAFLIAAAQTFPRSELHGFEINPAHLEQARQQLFAGGHLARARLARVDFFSHDWPAELRTIDDPLILGNPPWVTSAAVSAVAGSNLPAKENVYGLRGLAAKTGKAKFDIAEWMLVTLIKTLRGRRATLAVLCKTATARKVLRHAWRSDLRITSASLCAIDAPAEFGAAVEACLLFARLGEVVAEILNAAPSQRFLAALVFSDAKRAITVELLQRLNLSQIAQTCGLELRWNSARKVAPGQQVELALGS